VAVGEHITDEDSELSTDLLYRFAYPDVRKSYCTIEPSTISMLAPWGTFLNFKDGVPQKSEDTEETEVTVG
jgi:hypothetical protein